MCWADNEFGPALWARKAGAEDERSRASLDAAFHRLIDALDRGPYLMGDRFTAVDVMAGATAMWLRELLPESATVDAYVARLAERPARNRALAKDAPVEKAA